MISYVTMNTSINARPAPARKTTHPSITAEQISTLVDDFYSKIRHDEQLGPIFGGQLDGRWEPHLEKMKTFWRSVLLKTGEYKGQPVPVHNQIDGLKTEDFLQWLELFTQTANTTFTPDAAPLVIEAAKRIASSLWLARSNDPFQNAPQWANKAKLVKARPDNVKQHGACPMSGNK